MRHYFLPTSFLTWTSLVLRRNGKATHYATAQSLNSRSQEKIGAFWPLIRPLPIGTFISKGLSPAALEIANLDIQEQLRLYNQSINLMEVPQIPTQGIKAVATSLLHSGKTLVSEDIAGLSVK